MARKNKILRNNREQRMAGDTVFSRRSFLLLGSSAIASAFMPAIAARGSVADIINNTESGADISAQADTDFRKISQFLTGKDLSPELCARAWWALTNHDSAFIGKYQALRNFIAAGNAADIDSLKTDAAFTEELQQTAAAMISAYYLGYVGAPQAVRAHDDTIFITYTQALMYRLDYERVPIPTYSRWGEDFWGSPENPD